MAVLESRWDRRSEHQLQLTARSSRSGAPRNSPDSRRSLRARLGWLRDAVAWFEAPARKPTATNIANVPTQISPLQAPMNKVPLPLTLTISAAASLGFAGGYLFHSGFGMELPAARQAVVEREVSQRVLDAFAEVLQAEATHKTLSSPKSMEELSGLQAWSKKTVLATIERFERIAEGADDRREKFLAQQFLPSAQKIRDEISAAR